MKIKVKLGIGFPGAIREDTLEVDDEELEGMTAKDIEDYLTEIATEWAWNYINIEYEKV